MLRRANASILSIAGLLFVLAVIAIPALASAADEPWTQQGSDIDGEAALDWFGQSVAISGDGATVVVGAPNNDGVGASSGHARVFELADGEWAQIGNDIDAAAAGDEAGSAVAISDDGLTIAIGVPFSGGNGFFSGSVRVLTRIGNTWVPVGDTIDGEAANNFSGSSVALSNDGSIVAIGAPDNDASGIESGHVRVFEHDDLAGWVQLGSDIDGEASDDLSGQSVALSGDGLTLAVGAPFNNGNGASAGHVRVFAFVSDTWTQVGDDIDGEAAGDSSGESVALSDDGTIIAIGAPFNDGNGNLAGHVRVLALDVDTWRPVGDDIDGEAAGDRSGSSIALTDDGMTIAIGAPVNGANGAGSGHLRVVTADGAGGWETVDRDLDGETDADQSATSVAMTGDGLTVAIGAPLNDANGTNAGHVRVYSRTPTVQPCLPGSFSATGAEPCAPAPAGTFVDSDGATEATPCPAGSYQPETGQSECLPADREFFVSTPGATEQTPCPFGFAQPNVGQAGCLASVRCEGVLATIVASGPVTLGTDGDDVIVGRPEADQILGMGGDDLICGGGGDDKLFGGQGKDRLDGGEGDDTLHGNRGDDTLSGGDGDDKIFGYAQDDTIDGGAGNDRLHGNFGNDTIAGGPGDDRIFGYGDNDRLDGGDGNDLIGGNFGDDVLNGGPGDDELYGSDGTDIVNGGQGNDLVQGNSGTDALNGNSGDDILDGGINVDACDGGTGTDTASRCETLTAIP